MVCAYGEDERGRTKWIYASGMEGTMRKGISRTRWKDGVRGFNSSGPGNAGGCEARTE